MNQKNSHIIYFMTAVVLLALQLPLIMGMLHFEAQHDHQDRCEVVSKQHLHQKKTDCDLYDVTLDSVAYFAFAKASTQKVTITSTVNNHYVNPDYDLHTSKELSRGPPVC